MEIAITSQNFKDHAADILGLFVREGESEQEDFKGKELETFLSYSTDYKTKRVLFVGLGKEKIDLEKIRRAAFLVANKAKELKALKVAVRVPKLDYSMEQISAAIVDGAVLGNYKFDKYITDAERKSVKIEKLTLVFDELQPNTVKASMDREKIICDNANMIKELVNENAFVKKPDILAITMEKIAKESGVSCKIMDEKELERLGLNLILAVNRGSRHPARLVVLEYNGDPKSIEKVALVGKGITFDSGGLNIKDTGHMETMKQDMAGAATVLGIIVTAAKLGIRKNLVGVSPLTENMPGDNAQKPGDVIKSYSGITVEVANTDAEGRLVLGDARAYAVKNYKPVMLIDLATLTGAITVALGDYAAGAMGNDNELIKRLSEAGERTGERVWQLPIFQESRDDIKSEIADIKNLGFRTTLGYGGSIAGAVFLEKFVGDTKWIHLDIANTAFMERERFYLTKGATGFGVRLLIDFLSK